MGDTEPTIDMPASARPSHGVREAVDGFVRRWRDGGSPRIEDAMAAVPEAEWAGLRDALRVAEDRLRREGRDSPTLDDPGAASPGLGVLPVGGAIASPSPAVPGYEILGELGRGGMGVVYKARQVSLGRLVALKVILAGPHVGDEALDRFRAEARAVARLQHPGVVQIHEVGEAEGRPYFSLEYVEGGTLADALGGKAQAPRRAAALSEALAEAVGHAHRRGIVHRDLKPANVLMTADGEPKVADFGLAKLAGAAGQTRAGAVMGTPGYMAPEQAAGDMSTAGPAADIHALGAILYEMLTGRPPYRAQNVVKVLRLTCTQEPEPPSTLRPGVPRDLETICLKCLRKDPDDRYEDAAALAAELRAFLAGEEILARPPGLRQRSARWARRHMAGLGLGVCLAAATMGLAAGAARVDAVATGAAAALALVAGGSWYGWRLRRMVAELDRSRAASDRQVERMHLVLEMTHRLMAATDADDLLRRIGETATKLADAERSTIFLVDGERGELRSRIAMGDDVKEIRVPLGKGIAGEVATTGQTTFLADCYADPRFEPAVDRRTGYRTRNLLAVPMRDDRGRLIGVLQVLNRRGAAYEAEDLEVIEALAISAAVAVGRVVAADRPEGDKADDGREVRPERRLPSPINTPGG